jgi:hypothetical protein
LILVGVLTNIEVSFAKISGEFGEHIQKEIVVSLVGISQKEA